MPICNVGAYDVPVNKIVLAPLPVNVEAASADKLGKNIPGENEQNQTTNQSTRWAWSGDSW